MLTLIVEISLQAAGTRRIWQGLPHHLQDGQRLLRGKVPETHREQDTETGQSQLCFLNQG